MWVEKWNWWIVCDKTTQEWFLFYHFTCTVSQNVTPGLLWYPRVLFLENATADFVRCALWSESLAWFVWRWSAGSCKRSGLVSWLEEFHVWISFEVVQSRREEHLVISPLACFDYPIDCESHIRVAFLICEFCQRSLNCYDEQYQIAQGLSHKYKWEFFQQG